VVIKYAHTAKKAIEMLDSQIKSRIKTAILGLTEKPPKGDIKPMQGCKDGRLRLRVGGYRVIYKYLLDGTLEILYIMNVGARGDIYK